MGKLGAPPPRIGKLGARIETTAPVQRWTSGHQDGKRPWDKWYKTARWQRLRATILKRDLYVCQVTGVMLSGKKPEPNSPVADHIVPHRGDPALFWDPENIRAVSWEYHVSEKQRLEASGYG